MTDLVVAEAHRGSGVGRMLLREAEAHCRSAGLKRLQISALAANGAALRAYEASGFAPHMIILAKDL